MHKWIAGLLLGLAVLTGCGVSGRNPESEVTWEGTYRLQGADNMEFTFASDSTLTVCQSGVYELVSQGGRPVVRICLDDTARELPEDYSYTDYLVEEQDEELLLTYTSEEFDLDQSPMTLVPLKGKNGLTGRKFFEGSYQIGDSGDSYQYMFHKDGTMAMQIKETYFADGEQITLADHTGKTAYRYEDTNQTLILSDQQGKPILVLEKPSVAEQQE